MSMVMKRWIARLFGKSIVNQSGFRAYVFNGVLYIDGMEIG
ncbi:hypothetical protein LCGC14_1093060 [marine sediment metagenome]|uniref:Uncharacterized protein n=1 Tax=marine sediment metagenome TaxID=412755 RepID=A0A0F9QHU9_9ZZZZ